MWDWEDGSNVGRGCAQLHIHGENAWLEFYTRCGFPGGQETVRMVTVVVDDAQLVRALESVARHEVNGRTEAVRFGPPGWKWDRTDELPTGPPEIRDL